MTHRKKISMRRLDNSQGAWIAVEIPKEETLIARIRQVPGRQWSPAERAWLLPYSKESYQSLLEVFPELGDKAGIPREKFMEIPVPKNRKDLIARVKQVPGRRWNSVRKVWEVPDSEVTQRQVAVIFGEHESFGRVVVAYLEPPREVEQKREERPPLKFEMEVVRLEEQLRLKRYSRHTVKTYRNAFRQFLAHFPEKDPQEMGETEIRAWLLYLVDHKRVSESYQNQAINAVKYYYEQVLRQERKTYYLDRPKKPKQLPDTLSENEIIDLLKSCR